jgi:hypothetical protein
MKASHATAVQQGIVAKLVLVTTLSCIGLMATGCSTVNVQGSAAATPLAAVKLSGRLQGGQQPVSGASIQLYAAGTSGYGAASTPLLTQTVTTDINGNFNITGDYPCTGNPEVYIVATGGIPQPQTGMVNNNLALMTALGPCSSLTANTSIAINERSTVAAVWALARFMSGYSAVGASAINASGLANAFSVVPQLVTLSTGETPGASLPANAVVPVAEINTLSNSLAACVNSAGGTAGDNSSCGLLFSAATVPGSSAPQDTIAAALNIARNPGLNPDKVLSVSLPNAPFQPSLTSTPQNFLLAITYSGGGLNAPTALAVDSSGNIWAANANSSLTEFDATGAAISPPGGYTGGGLNHPSSLAIDESGTVWVANSSGNSISLFNASGAPLSASPLTGGGLNTPATIAIDEDGSAWIANSGNGSLSNFSAAYTTSSPPTGYTGAGIGQPTGIAIDPY